MIFLAFKLNITNCKNNFVVDIFGENLQKILLTKSKSCSIIAQHSTAQHSTALTDFLSFFGKPSQKSSQLKDKLKTGINNPHARENLRSLGFAWGFFEYKKNFL